MKLYGFSSNSPILESSTELVIIMFYFEGIFVSSFLI